MVAFDKAYLQEGHYVAIVLSFVGFFCLFVAVIVRYYPEDTAVVRHTWKLGRLKDAKKNLVEFVFTNWPLSCFGSAVQATNEELGALTSGEKSFSDVKDVTSWVQYSLALYVIGFASWFIALVAMSMGLTRTNSPGLFNFNDDVRNVTQNDITVRGQVDSDWMLAVLILELFSLVWMALYIMALAGYSRLFWSKEAIEGVGVGVGVGGGP